MNAIKIFTHTPQKPEIFNMARFLRKPYNEVLGACVRLWCWLDEHTADGSTEVHDSDVDEIAGMKGLCRAMCREGWLAYDEQDCVVYLNMWQTSKAREYKRRCNARKGDA